MGFRTWAVALGVAVAAVAPQAHAAVEDAEPQVELGVPLDPNVCVGQSGHTDAGYLSIAVCAGGAFKLSASGPDDGPRASAADNVWYWVYACDTRWQCDQRSGFGLLPLGAIQADPLLRSASLSGEISGCEIDVALTGSDSVDHGSGVVEYGDSHEGYRLSIFAGAWAARVVTASEGTVCGFALSDAAATDYRWGFISRTLGTTATAHVSYA